jgi:hypothetical protein
VAHSHGGRRRDRGKTDGAFYHYGGYIVVLELNISAEKGCVGGFCAKKEVLAPKRRLTVLTKTTTARAVVTKSLPVIGSKKVHALKGSAGGARTGAQVHGGVPAMHGAALAHGRSPSRSGQRGDFVEMRGGDCSLCTVQRDR